MKKGLIIGCMLFLLFAGIAGAVSTGTRGNLNVLGWINMTDASSDLTVAGDATIKDHLHIGTGAHVGLPNYNVEVVENESTYVVMAAKNTNTGATAGSGIYAMNDANHFIAIGIAGTGNSIFGSAQQTGLYSQGYAEMVIANEGNFPIIFKTDTTNTHFISGTEKMRLTAAGDLGIGDASPSYKLTVNGSLGAESLIVSGAVDLNLNWTKLQNYPAACPAYSAITQVGDAVTCTNYELVSVFNDTGDMDIAGYVHTGVDSRGHNNLINAAGDVVFGNRLFVQNMGMFFAPPYGPGLMAHEFSSSLNITSLGGTATLNATTQYICDSTNPFVVGNEGMVLTVISSTPSFTDATGEITDFVNSTCTRVSFGSAGGASIVDATGMTYYVYPHPVFMALDNGYISNLIGENADAKFEIHIPNGTGFHGVYLEDASGADQHQSLTIDTDIKTYDGIVAYNNYLYSSTGVADIRADSMKLELDWEGVNDSSFAFISANVIDGGTNNHHDFLHLGSNIEHIIELGTTDTLASGYYEGTNVTANFTGVGSPVEVFIDDNDVIYIGSTTNFTSISVALSTKSSRNVNLLYYFCNSSGYYTLPGVIDTTNGFRITGTISFSAPEGRGTCHNQTDGTPFSDTTDYTYIALQRTRNNVNPNKPVVSKITVSGSDDTFILQEDLMKLNPVDTAPETCDAAHLGSIYFDISEDQMCVCTSGGWKEMDATGSACT
ncbi:MAG: hypothetical protein GY861_17500 [bacterium]|nr:hypothetical protein [bacterium]